MVRGSLLVVLAICYWGNANCQLKKFYAVKNDQAYDTIRFSLKATSGTCFIKPSHHDEPLTIYGNPDFSEVNPHFTNSIKQKTQEVSLVLEDFNKKGLSQAISHSMFGSSQETKQNYWKVYLTKDKIYDLNLHYGVGDATVNLSDISVSKIKLESGSADVKLTYDSNMSNKCMMDTLEVNVDMGTVIIDKMHAARAKYVKTEVGFGTVVLDLREKAFNKCVIKAVIGAGNLRVLMPDEGTPSIVNFNSSPLCKISFQQNFTEIKKSIFVNSNYTVDAQNLITFDLDVALGNITFEFPK